MISDEELNAMDERAGEDRVLEDIRALIEEVRRLRTGLALAWSDGWQAALDRPSNAEEAIRFRDLKHFRDVQAIIDGTTVD